MPDVSAVYNRYRPPLDNPRVYYEIVGGEGTTTYTYTVTAVNECGETDGGQVVVNNAPDGLSTLSYVKLSWEAVSGARSYRIYREGMFLYETTATTFEDTGAYAPDPNRTPPPFNETEEYKYLLWDSVAVVPSRYAQAAEINELQEILADKLKRLGDTLFKEGDIIKGCSLNISPSGSATVSEGYVYAVGCVRYVPAAQFTIPTSGTYYVGINTSVEYIDENDNPYLLDPAQAVPGSGQAGAYRRIVNLQWAYDADKENLDIVVWKVVDGAPNREYIGTQYSKLEETLARRDFDYHGQTLIEGFSVSVLPSPNGRDKVTLEIDGGKAYVNGFEIFKPHKTVMEIDISKDLQDPAVQEEVPPQSTGSLLYLPDQLPVGKVEQVTVRVKVAETRTVPSTQDACGWYWDDTGTSLDQIIGVWSDSSKTTIYTFSNTDPGCASRNTDVVLSGTGFSLDPAKFSPGNTYYIEYLKFVPATQGVRQKAYQEDIFSYATGADTYNLSKSDIINSERTKVEVVDSNGTVYENGVDFTVDTGRTETSIGTASITWVGNRPGDGVSFTVKYYYWDHVVEGDYVCVTSYIGEDFSSYAYDDIDDPNVIDFRTTGIKPASENPSVLVLYRPFLSQWAWLVLDTEAEFRVQRGTSSRKPVKPQRPSGVLPRYLLYLPAFDQDVKLYAEERYARTPSFFVNQLEQRLSRVESDLALTAVEQEAAAKQTSGPKRAIFTDSFTDGQPMADASNVSLDVRRGYLTLPRYTEPVSSSYSYDNSSGVQFHDAGVITLPVESEGVYTQQLIWTEGFAQEINPYAVAGSTTEVRLRPSVDYWVTEKTNMIVNTEVVRRTVSFSTEASPWSLSDRDVASTVRRILNLDPSWRVTDITRATWNSRTVVFETKDTAQFSDIHVLPELRQRPVLVWIKGAPPNEDNISATFDGIPVNLTVASEFDLAANSWPWMSPKGSAGTNPGTVKADSNGEVIAKFIVPKGVAAGEREVAVTSPSGLVDGLASYKGLGWVKNIRKVTTVTRMIVTTNISQIRRDRGDGVDPVAQSFYVDRPMFVSSIDLWFYRVPGAGNNGVEVFIKNLTEDGWPGSEVYGRTYLSKSEIMAQMGITDPDETVINPSFTNKVTFRFPKPVYLQPGHYAISIASPSNGYYLYTARMGKRILGNLQFTDWARVGSPLRRQPHNGVLFYSYNGVSWDIDQESDLMFRINQAVFSTLSGTVRVDLGSATRDYGEFGHIVHILTPPGTDVRGVYTAGSNPATEYEFVVADPRDASGEIDYDPVQLPLKLNSNDLQIDLILSTTNPYLSPVVAQDVNFVYVFGYDSNGVYISKNVSIAPTTFFNVKMWVDRKLNFGSASYYVSFDGGATWHSLPLSSVTSLQDGWEEVEFGDSLSAITGGSVTEASQFMFKIEISVGAGAEQLSPIHRKLRAVVF